MPLGARISRVRKAIAAGLGMLVTLALLVPQESIPTSYRPWVGVLLAAGTVAGVYQVKNAPEPKPPKSHLQEESS